MERIEKSEEELQELDFSLNGKVVKELLKNNEKSKIKNYY